MPLLTRHTHVHGGPIQHFLWNFAALAKMADLFIAPYVFVFHRVVARARAGAHAES